MLVGIEGSFLPEADDVALKEAVVGSSFRVKGETQVEFNAGLGVNAFMNA